MNPKLTTFILLVFSGLGVGLFSCGSNDIDISNSPVNVNFTRIEQEVLLGPPATINERLQPALLKHPDFMELYSQRILHLGQTNHPNYDANMQAFLQYCQEFEILKHVNTIFPNINHLESTINDAFKRYHVYFPQKAIPQAYTYISAFNESVVTDSLILGIALDKYLGDTCRFYTELQWDNYLRRRMVPQMIPVDALRAWAVMEFPMNTEKENMLSHMIYEGKIQLFLEKMLPNVPDSLRWNYTSEQLNWAHRHQKKIWTYFVENKLLFETTSLQISKFVGNAPFTTAFGNNSAPRTGVWLGYNIVVAYQKNNPNVTFQQIMTEDNYQKILDLSMYRP